MRHLKLLLRIGATVGLVLLLLRSISPVALRTALLDVDLRWLLPAILIPVGGIFLSAYKWRCVLLALGFRRSYVDLLVRYWSASFYNNLLPGSVGGDVVRIGGLARSQVPLSTSTWSVLIDRLSGLWAGLFVGAAITLAARDLPYQHTLRPLFCLLAVGGVAAVAVLIVLGRWQPAIVARLASLVAFVRDPRSRRVLALALAFQVLVVLHYYVVGRMLHIPFSLALCALCANSVLLTTLLPLSLNGIGVREGTLVVLLGAVGVSSAGATMLGLLVYASSALSTMPGSLLAASLAQPQPRVESV